MFKQCLKDAIFANLKLKKPSGSFLVVTPFTAVTEDVNRMKDLLLSLKIYPSGDDYGHYNIKLKVVEELIRLECR